MLVSASMMPTSSKLTGNKFPEGAAVSDSGQIKRVLLSVVILILGAAGTALLFREPRGHIGVDHLTGNWTSDCIAVSHPQLIRVRKSMAISATGDVVIGERYFQDESCNELTLFYEAEGKLVRGLQPDEKSAQVRLTLGQVRVTAVSSALVKRFVATSRCGQTDWVENQVVTFPDGRCDLLTPDGSSSFSDYLEVIDGDLVLGSGLSFFPVDESGAAPSSLLAGRMTLSRD